MLEDVNQHEAVPEWIASEEEATDRGGAQMSWTSRTFRVFVSSTFADLVEERDAFQRKVWPKLAKLCEKNGFRFQAIDLRWGISEEAGWDQRTARICLEEVKRCQETTPRPNFIILLGNRYGWRPLPEEIEASEFEAIEKKAQELNLPHCFLLRQWYRRDENALPPVYYLRRRSQEGEFDYTRHGVWATLVESPLRELIVTCASAIPLSEERRIEFERSLTEREILNGALDPAISDAKEHVFAYFREVDAFDQFESGTAFEVSELRRFVDFADAEHCDLTARQLQRNLKARLVGTLGADRVRKYRATWANGAMTGGHLEALCESVLADLTGVIHAEISKSTARDPLDVELTAHQQFGELRGGGGRFQGREELLSRIATYLSAATPSSPLVIYGPAGAGKSAIVARAIEEARERSPHAVTIERFIGATPQSADGRSLLQGLCQELGLRYPIEGAMPIEYGELVGAFGGCLEHATAKRPLLVFLDALDQLSQTDNARTLAWIPQQLPPHVRLVVSVLDTGDEALATDDLLSTLRRRTAPEHLLAVGDYPREDAIALVDHWLRLEKRSLSATQWDLVLSAFERCRRPLFLKLAVEEAKLWRWDEPTARMPAADSAEAMLTAMVDQLFDRLSQPSHHGPLLVERALGYLVAAKNGLTEDELIGVLSADGEFFDGFRARARTLGQPLPSGADSLPVAVWIRLYSDLQPYLTTRSANGVTLLVFYHRSLEHAARRRFLGNSEIAGRRHQHLASYFEAQDYYRTTSDERSESGDEQPLRPRSVNLRKIVELPWQRIEQVRVSSRGGPTMIAESCDQLETLFQDLRFFEAKAEVGMLFDLADDLSRCVDVLPRDRPLREVIEGLFEAIRRESLFIHRHTADYPQALFQSLWNLCWWYDSPEAGHQDSPSAGERSGAARGPKLCSLLEAWRREKRERNEPGHWLRSLRPPLLPIRSVLKQQWDGHRDFVTSISFSPDGSQIVSASRDTSVRACELKTGSSRTLWDEWGDGDPIRGVAWSPDGQTIVFVGQDPRGASVWAMATDGRSRRPFKPGTGCWDVAFAPDGRRIAVAGLDASIRVIDLTLGEEILKLEGHAQSVTAVRFSRDGRILASSSSDGTIRIWDAISGHERRCLRARGACVDTIAIAPDSSVIYSGSRDHMLRVWDLATGEMLRSTRYEFPVGALAISHDGRWLAVAIRDRLLVTDLITHQERSLLGHSDTILCLDFAPDGTHLASAGADCSVKVWTLAEETRSISLDQAPICELLFAPDGQHVVTGDYLGRVRFWDVSTGRLAQEIVCEGGPIRALVLTAGDSPLLVTGDDHGMIRRFRRPKGDEIWPIQGHEDLPWTSRQNLMGESFPRGGGVRALAASPDGRFLASGGGDGQLAFWVLETGRELCRAKPPWGGQSGIQAIAISSDGTLLAVLAGGRLGVLRLDWDQWLDNTELEDEMIYWVEQDRWLADCECEADEVTFTIDGEFIVTMAVGRGHDTLDTVYFTRWCQTSRTFGEVSKILYAIRDLTALSHDAFYQPEIHRAVVGSNFLEPGDAQMGVGPPRSDESCIRQTGRRQPVAWFPVSFDDIRSHPWKALWAASNGKDFCLFALERFSEA